MRACFNNVAMVCLLATTLTAASCSDDGKSSPTTDAVDSIPGSQDLRFPEDAGDLYAAPDQAGLDLPALPDLVDTVDGTAPDVPAWPDETTAEEVIPGDSCEFGYAFTEWSPPESGAPEMPALPAPMAPGIDPVAHPDPWPATVTVVPGTRGDLVIPGFSDDMPLFARTQPWDGGSRCYEYPDAPRLLTEPQAWQLYRAIAEKTTGVPLDDTPGKRTVVGLRGAYPGTFAWNGNGPNRFNDTLVLLWREADGTPRVREFPAHTDTGPVDFGWHNSSSLRPNRRYRYRNGWHKNYNALRIDEEGYLVRDDTNKNGHWDSDRNGWLPPLGPEDHDRQGSLHNIHVAAVDGPLQQAGVNDWSAGCQTVPGMANWTAFITQAWTGEGDSVDYFLIDTRDIDPGVWSPCPGDGSHACPYHIDALPFQGDGDTSLAPAGTWDEYNCSPANEAGPEEIYVLTVDATATLHVRVDDLSPAPPDIDIHLLDGNDPLACLARDNAEFIYQVPPGRYLIVADTWVEDGQPLAGPYQLEVFLEGAQ